MKNNLLLIFSILWIFLLLGCGEPNRNFKDYSEFSNDSIDNNSIGDNKSNTNSTNNTNGTSYKDDCGNAQYLLSHKNDCVEVGADWFKKPSSSEFAIYFDNKNINSHYDYCNIEIEDAYIGGGEITLPAKLPIFISNLQSYYPVVSSDSVGIFAECYNDYYFKPTNTVRAVFEGGGYVILTLP